MNVAPLGFYSLKGQFSITNDDYNRSHCYHFVRELVKEYFSRSCNDNSNTTIGTTSEVIKLLYKLLPYWGSDDKVVIIMWNYWAGKIGKSAGGNNNNR